MTEPKIRITINLDRKIVEYFKDRAMKEERQYQVMINRVLCDYVDRAVELDRPLAEDSPLDRASDSDSK